MSKIIASLSKMWLKIRNLENSLFPELQESLGVLSPKEEKLIKILDFARIEQFICDTHVTNIPKDRVQCARAFIAKSVYNLQTTSDLIDRLRIDRTLRVLCGWRYRADIPSESTFSRAFKEFSEINLAAKTHDKFISEYLSDIIFLYNASDATKIPLRQKPLKVEKEEKPKKKRDRPKKGETREPIKPTILSKQKDMKTTQEMLSLVSTECGVGIKQNSKGNREVWNGDIPITAIYSGANVHDSSVVLPLIGETSKKVNYLYDLLDAGYDAEIIREFSQQKGHRPIIDINPKNSSVLRDKIQLQEDEKKKFEFLHLTESSDTHHYNQRSMVERVNKYLKDDFGCDKIYYQGATKVASVLAFGILSICIHQSLKMIT